MTKLDPIFIFDDGAALRRNAKYFRSYRGVHNPDGSCLVSGSLRSEADEQIIAKSPGVRALPDVLDPTPLADEHIKTLSHFGAAKGDTVFKLRMKIRATVHPLF